MKKMLFSIVFLSIFAVSTFSHAENKEISAAKTQDIEKLLDLTISDSFVESYTSGFTQMFADLSSVEVQSPEDEKVILQVIDAVKEVIVSEFPEFKKEFVPVYDEYYTHEEIKELIAFYETPVGMKVVRTMPELMQKGMILGRDWSMSLRPKIEENLRVKGIL